MMKKIPKIILLLGIGFTSFINNVSAVSVGFADYSDENIGQNIPSNLMNPTERYFNGSNYGKKNYRVTYNYAILSNTDIDVNAYNLKNESIMANTLKPTEQLLAGTSIGLNTKETKTVTWSVDNFEVTEIRKEYTCNYSKKSEPDELTLITFVRPARLTCQQQCKKFFPNITDMYISENKKICSCKRMVYPETTEKISYKIQTDYYAENPCADTYQGSKYVDNTTKEIVEKNVPPVIAKDLKYKVVSEVFNEAKKNIQSNTIEVNYLNTNTYESRINEGKNISDITKTLTGTRTNLTLSPNEITKNNPETSGTMTAIFDYIQKNVCMDVKTAKVTYGRECIEGEQKIENQTIYDKHLKENITYWNYFIPLNTKTGSQFYINIEKKASANQTLNKKECLNVIERYQQSKMSKNECRSIINKNPNNYFNLISPINGYFTKDKNKDLGTVSIQNGCYSAKDALGSTYIDLIEVAGKNLTGNVEQDKKNVANGCYLSTKINFSIIQKFYNETSDGKTLKFEGFNFYYKPIDINNPFPNGIANDSYWKDWEKEKTDPNLKSSFDKISYIANNINVKQVREYNNKIINGQKNNYTNWSNMNQNGQSQFINNEGIIRRMNTDKVYKLGCGPLNEKAKLDNGQANPLYRSWCQS